jgi:hypothetical protein
MATLAKQDIPDYQKEMLEKLSKESGESITTIVRGIFRTEHLRLNGLTVVPDDKNN